MMGPVTRRRFLLGSAGLPALAGCSSILGPTGIRLDDVWLDNHTEEPQTFDLVVEVDGLLVHRKRYEVGVTANAIARTRASADVEVEEYSSVALSAQVEGRRATVDFTSGPYVDEHDGDCVLCIFNYDAKGDGEVRPQTRSIPDEACSDPDDDEDVSP